MSQSYTYPLLSPATTVGGGGIAKGTQALCTYTKMHQNRFLHAVLLAFSIHEPLTRTTQTLSTSLHLSVRLIISATAASFTARIANVGLDNSVLLLQRYHNKKNALTNSKRIPYQLPATTKRARDLTDARVDATRPHRVARDDACTPNRKQRNGADA